MTGLPKKKNSRRLAAEEGVLALLQRKEGAGSSKGEGGKITIKGRDRTPSYQSISILGKGPCLKPPG